MLVQAFQGNAEIKKFPLRVNFVENNEIVTASHIQKFSTHMTMNELSTNNGLRPKLLPKNVTMSESILSRSLSSLEKATLSKYFKHFVRNKPIRNKL